MLAAFGCAAMLAACGSGSGAVNFQARPGEHFSMKRAPSGGASLSDLGTQVTTDTLLRNPGAKLVKAQPFPACPGEAGEETFALKAPAGASVLRVAFTQWNGTTTIASYQRPAKSPDDPQAEEALRQSVCSTAL